MNKIKLIVLNAVTIAIIFILAASINDYLLGVGLGVLIRLSALIFVSLGFLYASFKVIDGLGDYRPLSLQVENPDAVKWWESKLFWLGLLQFVGSVVVGVTGQDILDSETVTSILGLDWANIASALMGLAVIVVRKYFTFFPIIKKD